MNLFQITLTALSSILFTLGVYSLSRVFIYRGTKKYLYFAITSFATSGYIFSQMLLSVPVEPALSLLFHRTKILFLIFCVSSWFFMIREMFLPNNRFPWIYLILSVIFGLFLPTELFLSMPVTHISISLGSIMFDYRFGKTNIIYIIYALSQIAFSVYAAVQIWKAKITRTQKITASVILIPLFSGFNDYAVTNRLMESIMIAEYAIWIFAVATFIMLVMEDQSNYRSFIETHRSLARSHSEITLLQNYLSNIIDSMPSILISLDNEGRITQWNTAAEKCTGISASEVMGKILWETQPLFRNFENLFRKVIDSNKPLLLPRERLEQLCKDEGTYYRIFLYPLIAEGIAGSVIRIDDMTELEKIEGQLRQMQKMDTVGTLAGGIAHDFNNILSGIVGTVSLIKYKLESGKPVSPDNLLKDIETIEHVSQRAADMVHQLLTLSRKTELSFAPVDLNMTIRHIMKICSSTFEKSIELRPVFANDAAMISADPAQIEQVLLNLCINASHAMTIMRPSGQRSGGTLTVAIHRIKSEPFFVSSHPEAKDIDYWVLSVQDTGVGMESKTIAKIFDPFFTTKDVNKGTGLGLAMVYNIVKQHGGFIDVYSEVGHGSNFKVYLPVLDAVDTDLTAKKESVIARGEGLVLVVDDEDVIRKLATTILTECGYSVLCASNGQEGIEMFKKEREKIRLVILDMIMPVKSGKETFLEMKSIDDRVRVLLSSGFKKDEQIEELLALGAHGFIQKPYTMEKLSESVYSIIA